MSSRGFPVKTWSKEQSKRKAWRQAVISMLGVVLGALSAWVISPEGAAVLAELLPVAGVVPLIQWLAVYYADKDKHGG